jgi:hypothetical protein
MRIKWNGHTARMGEMRNTYILVGSPEMRRLSGGGHKWKDNIKIEISLKNESIKLFVGLIWSLGFEVFTVVTMKNVVFWDVVLCRYFVNRRFGGTYCFHLQSIRNPRAMNQRQQVAVDWCTSLVKMETIRSSETSVNKISTRLYIPEDCILHGLWEL